MEIPVEAKDKIIRIYGKEGEIFLETLPVKLAEYISRWNLTDCRFMTYSQNLIYTCKSVVYGDVMIKAGVPNPVQITEAEALRFYDKKGHTCRLYEFSPQDGFLLIERVTPGYTLKNYITDPIKRAEAFVGIYKDYHLSCGDTSTYPNMMTLIEMFEQNLDNDQKFSKFKDVQRRLYHDISSKYSKRCLLHGDFNPNNLLVHNDTFKVIDPKGIIGDPVFDIARYLLNELTDALGYDREFNKSVVYYISSALGLPASLLYGLLTIDAIHSASYHLGNQMTKEKFDFQLKRCYAAYEMYNGNGQLLDC